MKSLRHPSIVKYLNVAELSSELHLIIERIAPLPCLLDMLDPLEITSGLYNVMEGLSFLHEQARISHNNICQEAVFVTLKGTWKIGELQHCCKFLEITPEFLKNSKQFRNQDGIAPEEKNEKLTVTVDMGHTRDVYSFGVMAENLLEYLTELGEMTKTFEILVQDKCLNPDPKQRPKISTIMDDQLFRNDLLYVTKFLGEVTLKSQKEKDEFFSSLYSRLTTLTEEVIAKQLVHLLLCRFVLLETSAATTIVPNILVPKRGTSMKVEVNFQKLSPLLTVPSYQKYVVPELIKMFHCHDYHIRMILLTYFSQYVDLFEKNDLENIIFPQVLLGVRDSHEDLAALSLHCLADLVKVLGRDAVIGGKSKAYFTKGTPKHLSSTAVENDNSKNLDKVLLKDLATYSSENTKAATSCKVADIKRQERKSKLKEQRLAREQKKLEQQQKWREKQEKETENEINNLQNTGTIIENSPREITSTRKEYSPELNGRLNPHSSFTDIQDGYTERLSFENPMQETMKSVKSEEGRDIDSFDVKVAKSWNDDRLDPDVYVTGDNSEEDWSDWDDKMDDFSSNTKPASPTESRKKSDKELYNHCEESFIQDGDSPSKSSHESPQPNLSSSKFVTNDKQSSSLKPGKTALKLQSSKKKVSKKENTPLGAEFEIKSTTTSTSGPVHEEVDFFKDMGLTPVIKKGEALEKTLQPDEASNSSSSAVIVSSSHLSYNMDENSQLDTVGWGDDLNWAEED
ncbi:protein-associating with the carboxyl-terminal domain of ezrin-like isoform X2 [Ostrea edulis]|nr:protein-associating with the carboxyl-terminal domain of ezrin-like isoform X2 [Ostrea edulis]